MAGTNELCRGRLQPLCAVMERGSANGEGYAQMIFTESSEAPTQRRRLVRRFQLGYKGWRQHGDSFRTLPDRMLRPLSGRALMPLTSRGLESSAWYYSEGRSCGARAKCRNGTPAPQDGGPNALAAAACVRSRPVQRRRIRDNGPGGGHAAVLHDDAC